jgi:CDP-glucose 4,6-dehydratase
VEDVDEWEQEAVTTADGALRRAYGGRRVLVTGHTGFKGSWLVAWLSALGAEVTGYALAPDTEPSMFALLDLASRCARHVVADVRDKDRLAATARDARPEIVFHLAAQPLVRESYLRPFETLEVNVMGTASLLEAVRASGQGCAVVVVTSDKCYENRESGAPLREDDAMGGHDVYSMSKGAAELTVASWRRSFFSPARTNEHGVYLATARAGNVIGGGDWARDRIVPDLVRALSSGEPLRVRNPGSIRPWQHVLEPLGGYLALGARLMGADGGDRAAACEAFNFGPHAESARPVRDLADLAVTAWGEGAWIDARDPSAPHEAATLRLAIERAHTRLGWSPRWAFDETVTRTIAWYRAQSIGASRDELRALTRREIDDYERAS